MTAIIPRGLLYSVLCAALLAGAPIFAQTSDRQGVAFFEKRVRPLLVKRCYKCHSRQAKKLQGGLFLDNRAGWAKGGESGPAIVPGKPQESLLIDAVRYGDLEMPPDNKLSAAEIAVLVQWVKLGAPDPRAGEAPKVETAKIDFAKAREYWAFRPLKQIVPPASLKNETWGKTPVDRFVLARLKAAKLKPNLMASRRTLIRRAYFDLLGLPPSPKEIHRFLNDPSSDEAAYSRLIDRLLDSPHFGERWGRHWLDVSRFAESHGFEQDYDRPYAYHFRDFVIKAFNQDMPFDQFVQWQLAGDELAPHDPLAMMATGFLGAGVFPTQITKNEVEQSRYDALDDMASTLGTAMLGLTIGCARCHDHKYDPIGSHDYYRLISTFSTTVRSNIELDLAPEKTKTAQTIFDKEHAPLVAAVKKFEREQLPSRLEQWLKTRRENGKDKSAWISLDIIEHKSKGGASFLKLDDGSLLASGVNAKFDTYTLVASTDLRGITAVRLDALADASLPKGGPGRATNGNFGLSDFRLTIRPKNSKERKRKSVAVKLVNAKSSFDQKGLPVAHAIDGDKKSCWAVDPRFGKDHAASFELASPIGFAGGTMLTFTLEFKNNTGHNIGRPRLSATTAPKPVGLEGDAMPRQVVQVLAKLNTPGSNLSKLNSQERAALLKWRRRQDSQWQMLNRRVQEHLKKAPKPKLTKVMVASEGFKPIRHHTQGADFFEKCYFLHRGDPNQKAGVASPSFLRVLMTSEDQEKHWQIAPPKGWRTSYRRRALANWITDTKYGAGHLLARVIVNRLWQHHIGIGIVATPNDFGRQGERPTHPELLDWLAAELIRGGWRLKPLHKLIMTSAVYRQDSRFDPAKAKIDPLNRFCWRRTPRRLEAEVIRDSLLAVSGTLDRRMFGPGVLDQGMVRRSVYFTIKRSKLIPILQLFDAPEPNTSIGRRPSTTIASQALFFMNNPHVRNWAKNFSRRLLPAAKRSLEDAVSEGYLAALGRRPTKEEAEDSVSFLNRQLTAYNEKKTGEGLYLALADFCQVLMSLNEFVYVD